jgi:hypothetical protein
MIKLGAHKDECHSTCFRLGQFFKHPTVVRAGARFDAMPSSPTLASFNPGLRGPTMATIRRRGNRWQTQIRRNSHPALTSSHASKRDAEIWARAVEAQLDRDEHNGPAPTPNQLSPPPNGEQGLTAQPRRPRGALHGDSQQPQEGCRHRACHPAGLPPPAPLPTPFGDAHLAGLRHLSRPATGCRPPCHRAVGVLNPAPHVHPAGAYFPWPLTPSDWPGSASGGGLAWMTSISMIFATRLSAASSSGLTTPEVASISGHRDPRMLFRYSHPMRQRVLNVIDRAQARGLG